MVLVIGDGVNGSSIRIEEIDGKRSLTAIKGTTANLYNQSTSIVYTSGETINVTFSADFYVKETGTLQIGFYIADNGWKSMTTKASKWRESNQNVFSELGWHHVQYSATLTNTYSGNLIVVIGYSGTTMWMYHPKIEMINSLVGIQSAVWTPHSDDTEYYTYGYDINIEKDVSGNGYDLEYSKLYPEINNDSAIHRTSFEFTQGLESTNSGIQYLSRPYFDFLTSTFTISCWVKLNSEKVYSNGTEIARQYIISQGRDTGNIGFNIAYQDSKIQAFYGVDTSNNRRLLSTNTMSLFIWYHIVVTWDGSNLVLYINGVKNSEGSLSGVDYAQCSNRFVIGKMAYLYTGTATYFPFVGNISDVRIYSTALSETDIKELYNVRASLDKNGNYYTSDIVEE